MSKEGLQATDFIKDKYSWAIIKAECITSTKRLYIGSDAAMENLPDNGIVSAAS